MIDLSHLPQATIMIIEEMLRHVTAAADPASVARAAEEAARVVAFDQLMSKAKP